MLERSQLAHKVRNKLAALAAEARLWRLAKAYPKKSPRVLFFPSGGREGASLLRAYNIADALGDLGWVAATVPGTVNLSGRARIVRRFRPDLLVFQQCRHPLNDGNLAFGVPYVVDTDDADFHLEIPGLRERLERTVQRARGVIAGSRYIREYHQSFNPNVAVIWTGTPISKGSWPRHADREAKGSIIAWAQTQPLDYAKELEFVVELHTRLRAAGSDHRLRLYGVDNESQRREISARFGSDPKLEIIKTLPYAEFLASLTEVSAGLCPLISDSPFSRGKSFGKVLAYLDAGIPVVASDAADHSLFFDAASGVISNDIDTWVEAVLALLANPGARDRMAEQAHARLVKRLSIEAAAARTNAFLRGLLGITHKRDQSAP